MQAYYGGDPMSWIAMPLGWLRAFSRMMPRLQAREQLRRLSVAQLALREGSAEMRDELLAALLSDAEMPSARDAVAKAGLAELAAATGIRVVEE